MDFNVCGCVMGECGCVKIDGCVVIDLSVCGHVILMHMGMP